VQSVADVLLTFFNGGKPGVEASEVYRLLMAHGRWMMSHVWALIACRRLMVASGGEGHVPSLEAAGDLLIWMLLVIVEVAVLPYLARSLLPGSLRVMWRGLLLANMARMMHQGRSCFVKTCITGVSRAFRTMSSPQYRGFRLWVILAEAILRIVIRTGPDIELVRPSVRWFTGPTVKNRLNHRFDCFGPDELNRSQIL
jgi:hypothetical protein